MNPEVAYEVAQDAFTQLIGYAASRIDREAAKPVPDEETLDKWRHDRDTWARRRQALDPPFAAN